MSVWKNSKKFSGTFSGHYEHDSAGERVFVLKRRGGAGPLRKVYESHEAAKNNGWKKLK